MSPIHSLPDDVLQHIFLFYVDPSGLRAHDLSLMVTLLRLVCNLWDTTARYTPRLWSDLHLIFKTDSPLPPPKLLQKWVDRSSEVPLNIDLNASRGEDDDDALFAEYLDVLSSAIHRWRNLRIYLTTKSSRTVVDAFKKYNFALAKELEFASLTLRCRDSRKLETVIEKISLAPYITHFRWAPCNPHCAHALVHHFPLHRLTTLYLGFYELPSGVDILRKCTSARHITLYFLNPKREHYLVPHTPQLYLSQLRVIELVVMDLESPLLALLHAPKLSILCIHFATFPPTKDPPPSSCLPSQLKSFLSRHRSLQVLLVNSLPYGELMPFLRAPELQPLAVVEIIYPALEQYDSVEQVLIEERKLSRSFPRPKDRKKVKVKPLKDGALVVGWTDAKMQAEFHHESPNTEVRMCGRTMEWMRVLGIPFSSFGDNCE